MPLKVTEQWSASRLSLKVPWTAHMEWMVSGAATAQAALTAVDPTNPTIRVAQINNSHQYHASLKCSGPFVIKRIGLDGWLIGADFAIPSGGEFNPNPSPNVATMAKWSNLKNSEPVDLDVGTDQLKALPILASNGQPPDSPFSRPTAIKGFVITKTLPAWDPNWNRMWENGVSEFAVSLGNGKTAEAYKIVCTDIIPPDEFPITATSVRMAFAFEVVFDDQLGKYPFAHRMMDSGTYGFAPGANGTAQPTSSKFWNGTEEHSSRIRLKNDGTPYPGVDTNNALKVKTVGGSLLAPVANPVIPPAWKSEELTDTKCWVRYYRKFRLVDLRPLMNDLLAI